MRKWVTVKCEIGGSRGGRLRLKCDGTRAETRFRLSAKRTSPLKSAGSSVQSTTGSRGVGISGSNAAYTMFRGSVKSTDYPLHSPVSPSLPLPCVTVCHHISTGLYSCLLTVPVAGVVQICRRFGWMGHHPNCRPPDYTVYHSSLSHLRYHTACNGKLFHLRTNLLVYWVREVDGQNWGHGTCDSPHR
jgi:hypothetical protein